MMKMNFPAEMETIDAIPVSKVIDPSPVLLNRKPQSRPSAKAALDLRDVEYHQPYLIPTSEIPFTGASLKHTNWANTRLNAKRKPRARWKPA
jgi:hypothetical protein